MKTLKGVTTAPNKEMLGYAVLPIVNALSHYSDYLFGEDSEEHSSVERMEHVPTVHTDLRLNISISMSEIVVYD